jgi:Putative GRINL1B complex locus protein 2
MFIGKLPDKGQKIQDFCSALEKRIEELKQLHQQQNYTEGLTEMFSSLSVGCNRNKVDINQMEWTGKVPYKLEHSARDVSDHDDSEEEKDVVKILATTNQMSKIVIDER